MLKLKTQTFTVLLIIALTLFISACAPPGSGSSLSSLQVLQSSAEAMKNVKSSHIEMQTTSNTQVIGAATSTTNVAIKGSGDAVLPDQEQMKLNITNGSTNSVINEIVQGNKVYIQNDQGQWYVLDRDKFQGMVSNPLAGVSFDQNSLLGLIQHTKITDHGTELINGTNLRHIGAELDKEALRKLLTDNPQLQSSFGQQDIETVLANLKSFQTTVDVWIDETQFYVHRTQLVLKLDADTSSVSGAPQRITTDLNTTVDLSKFNEPVTITPPTNAIPTDNPADVLGS